MLPLAAPRSCLFSSLSRRNSLPEFSIVRLLPIYDHNVHKTSRMFKNDINGVFWHTSFCGAFLLLRSWPSSALTHVAVVRCHPRVALHPVNALVRLSVLRRRAFRLLAGFHESEQCQSVLHTSLCTSARISLGPLLTFGMAGFRGTWVDLKTLAGLLPDAHALSDPWDCEW